MNSTESDVEWRRRSHTANSACLAAVIFYVWTQKLSVHFRLADLTFVLANSAGVATLGWLSAFNILPGLLHQRYPSGFPQRPTIVVNRSNRGCLGAIWGLSGFVLFSVAWSCRWLLLAYLAACVFLLKRTVYEEIDPKGGTFTRWTVWGKLMFASRRDVLLGAAVCRFKIERQGGPETTYQPVLIFRHGSSKVVPFDFFRASGVADFVAQSHFSDPVGVLQKIEGWSQETGFPIYDQRFMDLKQLQEVVDSTGTSQLVPYSSLWSSNPLQKRPQVELSELPPL